MRKPTVQVEKLVSMMDNILIFTVLLNYRYENYKTPLLADHPLR
jgi:hypothetical protein